MLDDLRNSSSFLEDEDEEEEKQQELKTEQPVVRRSPVRRRSRQKTFLGLTAQERFIVSLALLMMVCILGTVVLLITQTISLPF
jgi:hypothetical protein